MMLLLLLLLMLQRSGGGEATKPTASQLVGSLRVETLMPSLREPRSLVRPASNNTLTLS